MMKLVIDGHTFPIKARFLWTDSSTAHTWINGDPYKYRPFVAHRVSEILDTTTREEWRWLRSKMNSADEATKWGVGPHFNDQSIWYSGPKFLQSSEENWPCAEPENPEEKEMRSCFLHHEVRAPERIVDVTRFSNWNKLLRMTAYVHRFVSNARTPVNNRSGGPLARRELQKAEVTLFRMVQWECYPEEMIAMANPNEPNHAEENFIEKSSVLYSLTPRIDTHGVLRVDGRIGATKGVTRDVKFPVILPKKHHVTNLILEDFHRRFKHGNNSISLTCAGW